MTFGAFLKCMMTFEILLLEIYSVNKQKKERETWNQKIVSFEKERINHGKKNFKGQVWMKIDFAFAQ